MHRSRRAEGSVRIVTPPGFRYWCAILGVAAIAAIVFLSHGSYARKTTVSGLISADIAIKRVLSPRAAIVESVHVAEGETVMAGQPIARLRVSAAMDASLRRQTRDEYHAQVDSIDRRIAALERQHESEHKRLAKRGEHLLATIKRYSEVLRLQAMKCAELEATRSAAQPLFEKGLISRLEWGRLNEAYLAAEQQRASMQADQTERENEVVSTLAARQQLEATTTDQRLALEQQRSSLRQQIAGMTANEAFDVTAPVSGKVSRIHRQAGHAVAIDEPLASVRPRDSRLQATLFIPSGSAGFVAVGQSVNLLYDAFPHQQFGSYDGTLIALSEHALLPGIDASANLPEPVFEATVALATDSVRAFGKTQPLRHGMTLRADIVMEQRSLLDWLLAPLFSLRGRT